MSQDPSEEVPLATSYSQLIVTAPFRPGLHAALTNLGYEPFGALPAPNAPSISVERVSDTASPAFDQLIDAVDLTKPTPTLRRQASLMFASATPRLVEAQPTNWFQQERLDVPRAFGKKVSLALIRVYDVIIDRQDGIASDFLNRSHCYASISDYAAAIEDLTTVCGPGNPDVLGRRGYLKLVAKDYTGAFADIKLSIQEAQNDSSFRRRVGAKAAREMVGFLYNNLALVYEQVDRNDAALECYNRSISIVRTQRLVHNRGSQLGRMNKFRECLEDFNWVIKQNPNYLQARDDRIYVCLFHLDAFEIALKDLNFLISVEESSLQSGNLFLRGYCHGCLGDYEKSTRDFQMSLEISDRFAFLLPNEEAGTDGYLKRLDGLVGGMQILVPDLRTCPAKTLLVEFLKRTCAGCFTMNLSARRRHGLHLCSGCRLVRYCSEQCQRSHWDTHKKKCRALRRN